MGATDALDFKLDRLLGRSGTPSVEATRRVVDDVLGIMAAAPALPSKAAQVKQELIVTRLAQRLGLRQETVWARLAELKTERRRKEQQPAARPVPQASAARVTKPAAPPEKADLQYQCERQLLQLVLADAALIPKAAAAISPDQVGHTGLRRMLAELYAIQAAGGAPDLDALRERLADRPDLFEAAQKLHFVGETMQDREQWLGRVFRRLAELRDEAERRKVREQLEAGADADAAADLLRKLQQKRPPTEGSP